MSTETKYTEPLVWFADLLGRIIDRIEAGETAEKLGDELADMQARGERIWRERQADRRVSGVETLLTAISGVLILLRQFAAGDLGVLVQLRNSLTVFQGAILDLHVAGEIDDQTVSGLARCSLDASDYLDTLRRRREETARRRRQRFEQELLLTNFANDVLRMEAAGEIDAQTFDNLTSTAVAFGEHLDASGEQERWLRVRAITRATRISATALRRKAQRGRSGGRIEGSTEFEYLEADVLREYPEQHAAIGKI